MTVTRWWLEGFGPVRGEIHTGLVTEWSTDPDDPACPVEPPERMSTEWLASTGIGCTVGHNDGAVGWVEAVTSMRERPEETKARKARAKQSRQVSLL